MSLVHKIGTAIEVTRKGGIAGLYSKIGDVSNRIANRKREQKWIAANGPLSAVARQAIERKIAEMPRLPLISVIMPVYNVDEVWLRKCIDSVLGQVYQNWELCIADDHSPKPHIRTVLDEYSLLDERVKVVYREANGHISAASNSALAIASGEFCVLLDHDDELAADALYWVADEICRHPEAAMIYSDEDMIDDKGRRFDLKFKPDFSYDLLLSLNLVTHLSAYSTEVLGKIGGFRVGLEGSQDYDLALRVIEEIGTARVSHIPRVLYHWRAIPGSVALSGDEKPYAHDRARLAISEHLARCGAAADVEPTNFNLHRVRYRLPEPAVSVSLIVHGDEATGLEERFNPSGDPGVEIVRVPRSGEFAADLNRAVRSSTGEILIFVDAALEPPDEWMSELVGFAVQPGIGAVGAKVIDARERVIDGGLVFGGKRLINFAHYGHKTADPGNMCRNLVIGNYSAVSISCMALRRAEFEALGGFDTGFSGMLAGADLCLRLGAAGKRIVHDPFVVMRLPKGTPRSRFPEPSAAEMEMFADKWAAVIARDPFYNPNLRPLNGDFRIDI